MASRLLILSLFALWLTAVPVVALIIPAKTHQHPRTNKSPSEQCRMKVLRHASPPLKHLAAGAFGITAFGITAAGVQKFLKGKAVNKPTSKEDFRREAARVLARFQTNSIIPGVSAKKPVSVNPAKSSVASSATVQKGPSNPMANLFKLKSSDRPVSLEDVVASPDFLSKKLVSFLATRMERSQLFKAFVLEGFPISEEEAQANLKKTIQAEATGAEAVAEVLAKVATLMLGPIVDAAVPDLARIETLEDLNDFISTAGALFEFLAPGVAIKQPVK